MGLNLIPVGMARTLLGPASMQVVPLSLKDSHGCPPSRPPSRPLPPPLFPLACLPTLPWCSTDCRYALLCCPLCCPIALLLPLLMTMTSATDRKPDLQSSFSMLASLTSASDGDHGMHNTFVVRD